MESPRAEDVRELLIEELLSLPTRGVEDRGDDLVVYLPPPGEAVEQLLETIRERIARVTGSEVPGIRFRWQEHEEWDDVWRRAFRPRRVTDRLVVSPSWEEPPLEPGDLLITLDPGMAFGTAEHPTTRGCLRLLDGAVRPGDRVVDVGAGSGILSIAAALLGAGRVLALEMDEWACTAAEENARTNGVEGKVTVLTLAVGPEFLPDEAPADGIVANIEAGALTALLPGFRSGLAPGGWLILSGILSHEARGVIQAAGEAGFSLRRPDREDAWWSGLFFVAGEDPEPGEPADGDRSAAGPHAPRP